MTKKQVTLSPLDIVILLKIIATDADQWYQSDIAEALYVSQSEVSKSVARCKYAGLLDTTGKHVMRLALLEVLQYGVPYIFPERPGAIVRGVPTAHAASPLSDIIESQAPYVWPYGKGKVRGESIVPLYHTVPKAIQEDKILHELLALVDALRVGRVREKSIAIDILKKRISHAQ